MTQSGSDQMSAEFDTVAWWTAQVVRDLGADHAVPAGCRGSGAPSWLDWLIDALRIASDDAMIDVGAGVGGPAAYAARRTGVRPVLVEPEFGACRAARTLFDLPVVQATGAAVPFGTARSDVVWCLGVVCTTPDDAAKVELLRELRRLVSRRGRVGLLVLQATTDTLQDPPEGNHFPTVESFPGLLAEAGLVIRDSIDTRLLDAPPEEWDRRTTDVDDELERRYADTRSWKAAQHQSARLGEMLRDGQLVTTLMHLGVDDSHQVTRTAGAVG